MNLHLVALKTTKYSDTQTILTAYSRERGRVSLALPAGSGKGAARVRALTMPLAVIECVSEVRPGREILPMRHRLSLSCAALDLHYLYYNNASGKMQLKSGSKREDFSGKF